MRIIYTVIFFFLFLLFSAEHGLCRRKWFAGSYGGLVIPAERDSKLRLGRGIELGRSIYKELEAGLFIFVSSIKERMLSSTVKNTDSFILLSGNYNLSYIMPGLYVSGKLGIVDRRIWDLPAASGGTTGVAALGYGLEAGYEYMFSPRISLSAGASYLHAAEASSDVGEGNTTYIINHEASNYFNIIARFRIYL